MFLLVTVFVNLALSATFANAIFPDITLHECALTKGCLRPAMCTESSCAFLVTWKLVSVKSENYVEFELRGNVQKVTGFIALAFSKDQRVVSYHVETMWISAFYLFIVYSYNFSIMMCKYDLAQSAKADFIIRDHVWCRLLHMSWS